jgi:hypothetical protein
MRERVVVASDVAISRWMREVVVVEVEVAGVRGGSCAWW